MKPVLDLPSRRVTFQPAPVSVLSGRNRLVKWGFPPWTIRVLHHNVVVEVTHLYQDPVSNEAHGAASHEQEDCSILCPDQPLYEVFVGSVQESIHHVASFSI